MSDRELLLLAATVLRASGRSVEGSVADARELLDALDRAEPELRRAETARAFRAAWRRAIERQTR